MKDYLTGCYDIVCWGVENLNAKTGFVFQFPVSHSQFVFQLSVLCIWKLRKANCKGQAFEMWTERMAEDAFLSKMDKMYGYIVFRLQVSF